MHGAAKDKHDDVRLAPQPAVMQAIYDQLPLGIVVVDAASRTTQSVNRRGRELLLGIAGATDGELDVTLIAEVLVDRSLDGERVGPTLIRVTSAAGSHLVFEVSATPLTDPNDVLYGAVLTFDDVTARERREQADREFVANAAHQIRTPITALMSTVAALQTGAKDDPPQRDRFLGHLEQQSDRLARLADALLLLARVSRGDGTAALSVVPLSPLLAKLVSSRDNSVRIECNDDVAALTNGPLLEQALQNALDNAIVHGRSQVEIVAALDGLRAVVEIRDDGPGMPEAERARVQERFFRGVRDSTQGFGLGLAIAAAAARGAAAKLEIESEPGAGTIVRFTAHGARLRAVS